MAHSFDTKAQIIGTVDAGQLYLSATYTCGAGATLLVLGIVTGGATIRAGGTPTYNGNAFTKAGSTRISGLSPETSCELWYYLAPTTGSALTISIPNTGSKSLFCCASSYKAQSGYSTGFEFANGIESSSGANPSVSTTLLFAGDVVVAVLGSGYNSPPTGRTQTSLYETDDGNYSDNHQYALVANADNIAMGWTVVSDDYCISVAVFCEVAPTENLVTIPASADAYVDSGTATTNYGETITFSVNPYSTTRKVSALAFDFSASIPTGATIVSAILALYASTISLARTISCHRLRRADWVEAEATYNVYKTGASWGTAGIQNSDTDYDTTDGAISASLSIAGRQFWTVTGQVQYALDTVAGLAHFLLWDEGASASKVQIYDSKESARPWYQPVLFIKYTVPSGPALLKTVNGLAVASVKTLRSGVVIASGKTWNGLA